MEVRTSHIAVQTSNIISYAVDTAILKLYATDVIAYPITRYLHIKTIYIGQCKTTLSHKIAGKFFKIETPFLHVHAPLFHFTI